jgi:ADP-ribose pyrophosphatase YjhB (NUDIX family)
MKQTTLCYPIKEGKVLLAMKKRGFGIGKWNGPGGKCVEGETIEETCRRETKEEIGVDLEGLEYRGLIEFIVEEKPEWNQICSIFIASGIIGEPQESEEMQPAWFAIEEMPYPDMWADDPIWLPGVIAGGRVSLRIYFDADGAVLHHEPL